MNGTQAGDAFGTQPLRVRDQAREVVALMLFTAAASGLCAFGFLLLLVLGE